LFHGYDWPGNIRELQNVVERSVIVTSGDVFRIDPAWLSTNTARTSDRSVAAHGAQSSAYERQVIERALQESRGRVSGPKGAAALLRLPASTLDSKIKKFGIQKEHFKLS